MVVLIDNIIFFLFWLLLCWSANWSDY